jgi:hypothetical protein
VVAQYGCWIKGKDVNGWSVMSGFCILGWRLFMMVYA